MSDDGVIRVGRKGRKRFAFGADGAPFEVDVVQAYTAWIQIDDEFRERFEDRSIPWSEMSTYHAQAVAFAANLAQPVHADTRHAPEAKYDAITTAEALDFIARLREQYEELTDFFQVKSRVRPDSPDTSAVQLTFSEEPDAA